MLQQHRTTTHAGEPEPLWRDAKGREARELATYTVEERRDDGAAILRRSVKAASTDALRQAVATERDEAVAWAEEEEVSEDEPGLVRCRATASVPAGELLYAGSLAGVCGYLWSFVSLF